MPVTESETAKRLPDSLRHPLATLHERFDALDKEARGRLRKALDTGNARLRELDDALARVSREDWTVPGMRRHLEGWRARAENLRATALKRVQEMPGTAVSALATGSRAQLQTIARGLAEISRRLEEAPPEKKNGPAEATAPTVVKSA